MWTRDKDLRKMDVCLDVKADGSFERGDLWTMWFVEVSVLCVLRVLRVLRVLCAL